MTGPVVFIDRRPIRLGKLLARGGEGEVYLVEGRPDWVLKFYIIRDLASRAAKVEAMVRAKLAERSSLVAYPIAPITDSTDRFAGFVMRMVPGHQEIHHLFAAGDRKTCFPGADYRFLVHAALNLARAIADVHSSNCVVGDVNSRGILVSDRAMVALIDADSFQITDGSREYPCTVGVPEYTPPELQGRSLDGVRRTTNHDAFGLAVIIFQILCMGRHPFIGSYVNGDMPMEKAIAEYRFAYSAKRSVGMKPPPGTVTLSDFPPQVAAAFEAAFDPAAHRPTAAQWVQLLEELESGLRRCASNPLHYYPGTGPECPWCRMERIIGITLFLPPAPSTGAIPAAASTSNFDIAAVWAAIEAVRLPAAAAPDPLLRTLDLDPSPEALAAAAKSRGQRTLNAILVGVTLGGIALSPSAWLLWLGVGGYNLYRLLGPARAGVLFRKRVAQQAQRWNAALDDWEKRCGGPEVHANRKLLEEARNQLQSLPAEHRARIAKYDANRREFQLRTYLENHRIGAAKIRGVGHRLKMRLVAYGIDSALQVSHGRVLQVDGVGAAKAQALMSWRQQVESGFRFDPNPNAGDAREKDRINREIAHKGDQLRTALARGARDLTVATQTVLARWKTVDSTLARVHRDRLQAETDDAFVNASLFARLKRMSSLAWAIVLMAIIGVIALLVHLPDLTPASPKPVALVSAAPVMERFDPPRLFRVEPGRGVRLVNIRQSPSGDSAALDRIEAGSSIRAVGRVRRPAGGSWIAFQRGDGILAYVSEALLKPETQADPPGAADACAAKPWALRRMCEDPGIKRLDEALTASYHRALHATAPADRAPLISGERQWIDRRDACEYQPDANGCLLEAYRSRTVELDEIAAGSTSADNAEFPAATATQDFTAPPITQVSPPVARGDPSLVTSDDYPPAALRAGEAGRVTVRLHVMASGAIDGCDVSTSSGFADLDETTCRLLTRRLRFSPAKDASGASTDTSITKSVDWTLPQP